MRKDAPKKDGGFRLTSRNALGMTADSRVVWMSPRTFRKARRFWTLSKKDCRLGRLPSSQYFLDSPRNLRRCRVAPRRTSARVKAQPQSQGSHFCPGEEGRGDGGGGTHFSAADTAGLRRLPQPPGRPLLLLESLRPKAYITSVRTSSLNQLTLKCKYTCLTSSLPCLTARSFSSLRSEIHRALQTRYVQNRVPDCHP